MSFSSDFKWGAASASYQIEGGAFEDGKGLSIWDVFSHTPGKMYNGHTGDVACDAYHRYAEDLDLLGELGADVYRFSISWPRVLPEGTGPVNAAGLAYYDRVVDGLLERGIEPWITLYHWDLPQALQDHGGWADRKTAEAFAEYAAVIAGHFGSRVKNYITLNEPQCVVGLGNMTGVHAPGYQLNADDSFVLWHNLMLAHGMTSRKIRELVPDAKVSLASTGNLCYLPRESDGSYPKETPEALSDGSFLTPPGSSDPMASAFTHQWFLDPVCLGHYPEDPGNVWYQASRQVSPEDLEIIHQVPDFISLNIYNGHELQYTADGNLQTVEKYPGYPRTSLKWPVTPEVLYWGPRLVWERYGLPVCISENGEGCNDLLFLDGKVHDPCRIDFLHRYLRELKKAAEDGVPVNAYLHWSLTDNLEWYCGYDDRFGLIFIDYQTGNRIPKDSFYWYRDVIASNGDTL